MIFVDRTAESTIEYNPTVSSLAEYIIMKNQHVNELVLLGIIRK